MKQTLILIALFFSALLQAQVNTQSMQLSQEHPRYLTGDGGKETSLKLIND